MIWVTANCLEKPCLLSLLSISNILLRILAHSRISFTYALKVVINALWYCFQCSHHTAIALFLLAQIPLAKYWYLMNFLMFLGSHHAIFWNFHVYNLTATYYCQTTLFVSVSKKDDFLIIKNWLPLVLIFLPFQWNLKDWSFFHQRTGE